MDIIKVLPKDVSDLIAAGEVVERPASVVKELVENSIDAQATEISIEIIKGGCESIKITDNGIGMSPKDAETAFLKHATSKISIADDLSSIHTLGFRGEALCAISSVSIIDLYTNQDESSEGIYLHVEYGVVKEKKKVAFHKGTSIEVKNLFSNTPARLKFMKGENAETAAISNMVQILAISNVKVAFKYYVNSIEKLFTYGNGVLLDTIYAIEGKEFAGNLIKTSLSSSLGNGTKKISVYGYIGKAHYNKASRNKEFFFVNNRFIKSKLLQTAVENGYKSFIMQGRFPVCVLNINIPYDEVDINVHPGKIEAKFSDERSIFDLVIAAVNLALTKSPVSQPEFKVIHSKKDIDYSEAKNQFVKKEIKEEIKEDKKSDLLDSSWHLVSTPDIKPLDTNRLNISASSFEDDVKHDPVIDEQLKKDAVPFTYKEQMNNEKIAEEQTALDDNISRYRYIGQCLNTYILLEDEDNLILIDKHALHERINFERLKAEKEIHVQTLLTPLLINFDNISFEKLLSGKDLLNKIGISVDSFGDCCIAVRTIPSILAEEDIEGVLNKFLNIVTDNIDLIKSELIDELLYDVACKASIKGGEESSEFELRSLAEKYLADQKKYSYCPHGRPVMVTFSKSNIENNFKRKI